MAKNEIIKVMAELAKYNSMADEIAGIIDGLKDEIKEYMRENNIDTLASDEHKATYKAVESSRLDSKALRAELPEIASRYTVTNSSMRFNFS